MPKIFLIVWFKIDYEIYLLTNKNQENREDKTECVCQNLGASDRTPVRKQTQVE
jgi:hypothetical protein